MNLKNPSYLFIFNAWYQTFTQDIEDAKTCQPLTMPVLGIGSYISYNYMKKGLP